MNTAAAEPHLGRRPPEDHHRDVTGGALRASVFGAMDGIVSNTALISGVAGGGASTHVTLLTGFAGLVAGAFSMATGEYTSVKSQNEATLAEIDMERLELERNPHEELNELAHSFYVRGVDLELAKEVARQLSREPEAALRVHAQTELGINVDHLPSPWVAAGSSLASFAVGAVIPIIPFIFGGPHALLVTLLLAAVALFMTGAVVSRLTGRSWAFAGTRQLALGVFACGVTYLVGAAIGAGVS